MYRILLGYKRKQVGAQFDKKGLKFACLANKTIVI